MKEFSGWDYQFSYNSFESCNIMPWIPWMFRSINDKAQCGWRQESWVEVEIGKDGGRNQVLLKNAHFVKSSSVLDGSLGTSNLVWSGNYQNGIKWKETVEVIETLKEEMMRCMEWRKMKFSENNCLFFMNCYLLSSWGVEDMNWIEEVRSLSQK